MKITFNNPEILKISKDSEVFEKIFVEELKEKVIEDNHNIEVDIVLYDDTDLIEYIDISNLKSIEEYNYITSKVVDLLSNIRESIISSKIERKFYSKNEKLLSIVNFHDFNRVNITFVNPDKFNIEKNSKIFKKTFEHQTISELKEKNSEIKVKYHHYENSDIIESINLLNIQNISDYNYICEKIMELLSEKAEIL